MYVLVGAGLVCLLGLVWWMGRQRILKLLDSEKTLTRELEKQLAMREYKISSLDEMIQSMKQDHQEKKESFEQNRKQLQESFEHLASHILAKKADSFQASSGEHLGQILEPFRVQIEHFRQKIVENEHHTGQQHVHLMQEIAGLRHLNQEVTKEARELTQALKGQQKSQGQWGELILERLLEHCGLQQGREYHRQLSSRDQDGKLRQPDIVLTLPGGRQIIIDAKVSLTAFERAANSASSEDELKARLDHVQSIKRHLDDLSRKSYQDLENIDSLDFVVMFVPVEQAYIMAIGQDGTLFEKAFEKNIVLASPSTLMTLVKVVHYAWRQDRQNQNVLGIVKLATDLQQKFEIFLEKFEMIGKSLQKADQSYQEAHRGLMSGRGNITKRIQDLQAFGIKSSRTKSNTACLEVKQVDAKEQDIVD